MLHLPPNKCVNDNILLHARYLRMKVLLIPLPATLVLPQLFKVPYRLKACPDGLNCCYKWYCQMGCLLVNAVEPLA